MAASSFSSVGAPHSPFLSSIVSANFPRASRRMGVSSRGDAASVSRTTTTSDLLALFRDATEIPEVLSSLSLPLSSKELSRVKSRGQPSTLMRYRGALTTASSNCEEERALLSREYNDSTIQPLGSDRELTFMFNLKFEDSPGRGKRESHT